MLCAQRMGRFGSLIDKRLVRAVLAGPQDLIRSRLSYRLTRLSRAASLGYMAIAHKTVCVSALIFAWLGRNGAELATDPRCIRSTSQN